MREVIRDPLRLQHIKDACERLLNYFDNEDVPELNEKDMSYFGIIKNLEIIGEAAYKLTNEFVDGHPELDWRSIIAMRHVMVHGYYKVNSSIVREIVKTDVPIIYQQVKVYLSDKDSCD